MSTPPSVGRAAGPRATTASPRRTSRRGQILELFTTFVSERGYDETSISDLAVALGVSKGTIIHHFSSKDQLLFEMSLTYMERRVAELEIIVAETDDPAEQLTLVCATLFLVHRDDRDATIAVSREFVRFISEPVMSDVRALRTAYRQTVESIIRKGISSGVFHKKTQPGILALQLFGMCNWAWTWFHPEGEWSADDVVAAFIRTLLNGVLVDSPARSPRPVRLPRTIVDAREQRLTDRRALLAKLV